MPEGERAVLELVVIDQLTVTEAAMALGIRSGTAKVRLHRARRTLRGLPFVMEGTPG
ncbi:RNA polymerase sigma factor [Streptosporangium canum]|uniref:RNA polymerase sigma factor n=1 Tax=Streptosporangium canum TaxID=324952 RepID=UPI003687A1D9